jgi:hypothetical protein
VNQVLPEMIEAAKNLNPNKSLLKQKKETPAEFIILPGFYNSRLAILLSRP